MKTVAIIAEYNPFHTGHEYQINKIREELGSDTRIVAIMSGSFTQRGEVAVADKYLRAECAVRCGANLVLELPFPFSASSAEFFAKSGIKIANSLGVIDTLSFGSECGNINLLSEIAENMSSAEYQNKIAELTVSNINSGYPQICEMAYSALYNTTLSKDFFSPNNILAIEYIKALKTADSTISPHTIKRYGAGYSEKNLTAEPHQSASAIRGALLDDVNSALKNIPDNAKFTILTAYNNGELPCDSDKLSAAVISFLRLNFSRPECDIHDATGGLYNRLQNASFEASTISKLTALADTKKYTTARIRRAIWYSFFGVTSSEVKELPLYTNVLAMDNVGKAILKEVKKTSDFPVVTKPSSYDFLPDTAKRQKEKSDRADSIFQLTKPTHISGSYSLKCTPYIKKPSIS